MNLAEHYNNLYKDAIVRIASQNHQIDNLIDSSSDNRFGITLLIRPDNQFKGRIQEFISALKAIEPAQYYYRNSDIHVTVMSIISCYDGFDLSRIFLPDYIAIIEKSIASCEKFEIDFKGITASSAGIMIQGFLNDNTLNSIRENLRINFRNSILEQTIDKRYSIQTAHATVVRFRKKLTMTEEFIEALDHYRDFDFGTTTVNSLELVFNDWYQRKECVKELYRFELN